MAAILEEMGGKNALGRRNQVRPVHQARRASEFYDACKATSTGDQYMARPATATSGNTLRSVDLAAQLGAKVPPKVRNRVWSHEYVELEYFAFDVWDAATTRSDTRSIFNYDLWSSAFRTFSAVFLQVYPSRVPELLMYAERIHNASKCLEWANVYAYDKAMRAKLAANKELCWGTEDPVLWTYMANAPSKVRKKQGVPNQDQRTPQHASAKHSPTPTPKPPPGGPQQRQAQ